MAKKVIRTIRRRGRATVRYRRLVTSTLSEPKQDKAEPAADTVLENPSVWENDSLGWLASIRDELPIRIEDLPDLKARHPGFAFRVTWPQDSPSLMLEVEVETHGAGDPMVVGRPHGSEDTS